MKLYVNKIEHDDNVIYITGTTSIGQIKGIWHYREKPIINTYYFFELSIPELDISQVSVIKDHFESSIYIYNDKVVFKCVVESIDDDDVYCIRLSHDWIEIIGEIKNDNHSIKGGDYVTFSVNFTDICIYPYD